MVVVVVVGCWTLRLRLESELDNVFKGKIRLSELIDLGLGCLLEVGDDVLVGSREPESVDGLGETGLPPGGLGGHTGGGGLVLPGNVSHLLGQVASIGQPVAPVHVVGCEAPVRLTSQLTDSFTNLCRLG